MRMEWPLRLLFGTLLLSFAMPFIVLGGYTVTTLHWWPRRDLSAEEWQRIVVARQHVALWMFQHGRLPTAEEFQNLARDSPAELRVDGTGFTYFPSVATGSSIYDFYFWDGDATITWQSTSGYNAVGEIDPQALFVSGGRGFDLLFFFGVGGTLLLASYLIGPTGKRPLDRGPPTHDSNSPHLRIDRHVRAMHPRR